MKAAGEIRADETPFTIADLLARARARESKAAAALESTARYLGLGLASVVNALDPAQVYIGGEITAVWDLIRKPTVAARRLADVSLHAGRRRGRHSSGCRGRLSTSSRRGGPCGGRRIRRTHVA